MLINHLQTRYPCLIDDETVPFIRTWLSARSDVERARVIDVYTNDVLMKTSQSLLVDHLRTHSAQYPIMFGSKQSQKKDADDDEKALANAKASLTKEQRISLALYLADKYLLNYDSSHCNPLPTEFLRLPWSEVDLLNM